MIDDIPGSKGPAVTDTSWPFMQHIEDPPTRRAHVQREQAFQGVVDRFLDRVVTPPFWTTGINHENELTDNARSRARGRGVKGGVPDVYVCQAGGRSAWIELKWGNNKPSDAQKAVHDELERCGIPRGYAWSILYVLRILREADFVLHGNADNLAAEYQARAEAAVRKAEKLGAKSKATRKSAPQKRLNGAQRKAVQSYARLLPR